MRPSCDSILICAITPRRLSPIGPFGLPGQKRLRAFHVAHMRKREGLEIQREGRKLRALGMTESNALSASDMLPRASSAHARAIGSVSGPVTPLSSPAKHRVIRPALERVGLHHKLGHGAVAIPRPEPATPALPRGRNCPPASAPAWTIAESRDCRGRTAKAVMLSAIFAKSPRDTATCADRNAPATPRVGCPVPARGWSGRQGSARRRAQFREQGHGILHAWITPLTSRSLVSCTATGNCPVPERRSRIGFPRAVTCSDSLARPRPAVSPS